MGEESELILSKNMLIDWPGHWDKSLCCRFSVLKHFEGIEFMPN
jgi:hypothetical protein